MKAEDLPDGIWVFQSGDGRFAGALRALELPRGLTVPSGAEPA
jgi:hypothetical protein